MDAEWAVGSMQLAYDVATDRVLLIVRRSRGEGEERVRQRTTTKAK